MLQFSTAWSPNPLLCPHVHAEQHGNPANARNCSHRSELFMFRLLILTNFKYQSHYGDDEEKENLMGHSKSWQLLLRCQASRFESWKTGHHHHAGPTGSKRWEGTSGWLWHTYLWEEYCLVSCMFLTSYSQDTLNHYWSPVDCRSRARVWSWRATHRQRPKQENQWSHRPDYAAWRLELHCSYMMLRHFSPSISLTPLLPTWQSKDCQNFTPSTAKA